MIRNNVSHFYTVDMAYSGGAVPPRPVKAPRTQSYHTFQILN